MAFVIRRREIVCVAASAAALRRYGGARREGKTGSGVYPVAVPTYQNMFVAQAKGFFKDEGYEFKLIQGGSGVKTREIIASRQGDFGIADIQHVLQLNKNGRPTRALMTARPARARRALRHPQGPVRPGRRHGAEVRRLEAARRQAGDPRRLVARRHLAPVVALFHGEHGPRRQGDLGRRRQCRHHAGLAQEQADRPPVERDLGGERGREERLGQGDLLAERREDLEFGDRRAGAGERQLLPRRHDREGAGEGPGLHQRRVARPAMDQGQQPGDHPGHHRAVRRLDVEERQPAGNRRAQGSRRLERPDPRGELGARREGLVRRADRPEAAIKMEDAVADKFLKAAHAKYPA